MASMVVNPGEIGLSRAPVPSAPGRQLGGKAVGYGGANPGAGLSAVRMLPEEDASEPHPTSPRTATGGPMPHKGPGSGPGQTSVARNTVEEREALPAAITAEQQRMAELAYACLLGDTFAWEALVRNQQRRVYGLCYRFTGSTSEAEDLTQEVFLKVYRNLRSFDPGRASFGVWLTALTRNLLVDHYRRSRMDRASESLDQSTTADADGPTRAERLADPRGGQERHVAGVELRAKIQAALAQVSPELREAVILRDLEDMDYREIAETLCIPQGTVKSRISRGRAELARLLKGMEGQVM